MQGTQTSQLWHETNGKTVFQSPRKYEVIQSAGNFSDQGFIVCNNIPVSAEGRPVFEYRFKNRAMNADERPGFIAMRVLRPLSNDTYIVMTMWESESDYNRWKNSEAFQKAHTTSYTKKPSKIFAGPSYVSTFIVGDDDDEQQTD